MLINAFAYINAGHRSAPPEACCGVRSKMRSSLGRRYQARRSWRNSVKQSPAAVTDLALAVAFGAFFPTMKRGLGYAQSCEPVLQELVAN